jgi:NADPH:quinone reductase-like Zn-dependent oxidoreductase
MASGTMRAVRFDQYGDVDVLKVVEVPRPRAGPSRVVVDVVAAAINPGEASIRKGLLHERWPATFPSGQGSDLAGVVSEVGEGVEGVAVGDEVIGWSDERSSQAEAVSLPADQVVPKPAKVPWEAAGSLYVVGTTAWATILSVGLKHGEVVAVSGAAGGVGSLTIQLARRLGATVLGIAGPGNADWLASMGVTPVVYGGDLGDRLRTAATGGIDAFIDCFGGGYVDLAVDQLGVNPDRVDTIIDRQAAGRHGSRADGMSTVKDVPSVIRELASLIEQGELEVPVAATFALDNVRQAYQLLEQRHTRGKIVLMIGRD